MGCDQSRDEVRNTDYEDALSDDEIKEKEKKKWTFRDKDYFYWVWSINEESRNYSEIYNNVWNAFPIDISKKLEKSYISKEENYSINSNNRKLLFDFKNKLIHVYNSKNTSDIETNDKNNNCSLTAKYSNMLGICQMKDEHYDSENSVTLRLSRVKVTSLKPKEEPIQEKKDKENIIDNSKDNKKAKKDEEGEKKANNNQEDEKNEAAKENDFPGKEESITGKHNKKIEEKKDNPEKEKEKEKEEIKITEKNLKEENESNNISHNPPMKQDEKEKKDEKDKKDENEKKEENEKTDEQEKNDQKNEKKDKNEEYQKNNKDDKNEKEKKKQNHKKDEKNGKDEELKQSQQIIEEIVDEGYFILEEDIQIFSQSKNDYNFFKTQTGIESQIITRSNSIDSNDSLNISNLSSNRIYNNTVSISKPSIKGSQISESLEKSLVQNKKCNNNQSLIYASDFFSRIYLFGIYDMPLYMNTDFIKVLKLRLPRNIYTLNELKEYLTSEIEKEAKMMLNSNNYNNNSFSERASKNSANSSIKNYSLETKDSSHIESTEDSRLKDLPRLNKSENPLDLIAIYEKMMNEFVNYKQQAEIYLSYIKQVDKDNIVEIILHIFSMKGFLNTNINLILKEKSIMKTNLNAFFVLLLTVLKCDGINNFFNFFYSKNLVYQEENSKKKFLRIYKDINCSLHNLVELRNKIESQKNKNLFMIKQKYLHLISNEVREKEKIEIEQTYQNILKEIEFISDELIIVDEILSANWNQSHIMNYMEYKSLLVIDFDIEIVKNNPSPLAFLNLHNYIPNNKEILICPGSVFAFKNIVIDHNNNLNIVYLEFIGNFFNPYENMKFSTKEILAFNELHVDNQKNKFQLNQEKIIEYFSEIISLNKNIKILDISENRINEALFQKLYPCFRKNFNIISLNLSNNLIGENAGAYIEELCTYNPFIENVFISNIDLKDEGLKKLENFLEFNKSLKLLDISNNNITFECADILRNIITKNNTLEKINLSYNQLTDEKGDLPLAQGFIFNKTLKDIGLCDCDLNYLSVSNLFDNIRTNSTLKIIALDQNKFTEDDVIKIFDKLTKNKYNFSELSFSEIQNTDKASQVISEFLRFNSYIKKINLCNNQINESSMKLIFEALKINRFLTEIDVTYNGAGKNILYWLSHLLLSNPVIRKISLKGNFADENEVIKNNFFFLQELLTNRSLETDIAEYFY